MNVRFSSFACLALALSGGIVRAQAPSLQSYPMETYAALGSRFAETSHLGALGLSPEQFEAFLEGVRSAHRGKPIAFDARAQELHHLIGIRLQQMVFEAQRVKFTQPGVLEEYMKTAVKNFKLQRADSGLAFGLVGSTSGARPAYEDRVVISCQVATSDGSVELPQLQMKEQQVAVADLVPGLAEGVQMMSPATSAMLILPPDLSYGSGPWPEGVPTGTPLIYTVKLHKVIAAQP